ncbi:MAG: transcription elongation factor GreA [bacterium]|nr:transcription elongation factor GreA [bacterium]
MEHLLTKAKYEELKEELKRLKTNERLEVAARLKVAKELGDLSENAEYFEAREAQEQLEKKIYGLEDIVHNAKIIKITKGKDTVSAGAIINVSSNGKKQVFTIVGASEADPGKGYISNESPIGKAFLGKKSGDKVDVETPAGKTSYKITKIA